MNNLLKYGRSLTPRSMVAKAFAFAGRLLRGWRDQLVHRRRCTYADPEGLELVSRRSAPRIDGQSETSKRLRDVSAHVVAGRFAIFSDVWASAGYGMTCPGFHGARYETEETDTSLGAMAARLSPGNRRWAVGIRRNMDADFTPIDWQRDIRSGYRWREDRWGGLAPYGHLPGVDIKVPWELGRLQHLGVLGMAWQQAKDGAAGFETPEVYARAYGNHLLDFIAANPPGYGVNWACTMDVAIRAANMATAAWLFSGAAARPELQATLTSTLLSHGRYIFAHLEWTPEFRGNHYLANLAGLIFTAVALPATNETDSWLRFAIHELIAEVAHQFNDDGSNFEASTSYHCLSAEMVLYATALCLGLEDTRREAITDATFHGWPKGRRRPTSPLSWTPDTGPFPSHYVSRLENMAVFAMRMTKPNGCIAQIGDNDSGRFFKLCPGNMDSACRENPLDHRDLAAAAGALFDRRDLIAFAGEDFAPIVSFVEGLSAGHRLPQSTADQPETPDADPSARRPGDPTGATSETVIRLPEPSLLTDLEMFGYPDFGVYVWRNARFFLSVRCGPIGQNGRGGHAHNDQLSIELNVDGEDWLADPGTYVYTAAPALRNAYRSVAAHAVPRQGNREPGRLDLGLFHLGDEARAECLRFTASEFEGVHWGFGTPVYRAIRLQDGVVVVRDSVGAPPDLDEPAEDSATVDTARELRLRLGAETTFSPGYGLLTSSGS